MGIVCEPVNVAFLSKTTVLAEEAAAAVAAAVRSVKTALPTP